MDEVTVLFICVGGLVLVLIAFLAGCWMDINQRIRWMRRFYHGDFGKLCIVSKDRGNLIKSVIVNFNSDRVIVAPKRIGKGNEIWSINRGKIYREDDVHKGDVLKIKYSEGVPVAFVSLDDLESLDFEKFAVGGNPAEVGSHFAGYLANQREKDIAAKGKTDQMEMLFKVAVIILLLATAYLTYTNSSTVGDISSKAGSIYNMLNNSKVVTVPYGNGTSGQLITGPTPAR